MTTTAEKIKVMQAFEDGAKIEVRDAKCSKSWGWAEKPRWDWDTYEYRIKPADPEPLECWGNLFSGHIDVYLSKDTCKKEAGYGEPVRTVINLREVTPQDEENAKDAVRYRKFKKLESIQPGCIIDYQVTCWDEMIEKAVEFDER